MLPQTLPLSQEQKLIVTVIGATGKQGCSIINSLLKDGRYKLRGVSRLRDEKKSQQLQEKGVDMFKANLATGEGLAEAFKGAYAAYLLTSSFDSEIEGKEYEVGHRMVDKAKVNGVKVLFWSTAPHALKISNGKYYVPQFTAKAKVEDYIRNIQKGRDAFDCAIFIAPSFYFQNFKWKAFCPKKDQSGCFVFEFPKVRTLTACDVHDLGPLFIKLLENPPQYNGKTVFLDGEHSPPQHYVQKFTEVTGEKACLKELSLEELEKLTTIHHGKELSEMFAFMDEFTYFGKEVFIPHLMHAREIYPEVKNWETYLCDSGWKGELEPRH